MNNENGTKNNWVIPTIIVGILLVLGILFLLLGNNPIGNAIRAKSGHTEISETEEERAEMPQEIRIVFTRGNDDKEDISTEEDIDFSGVKVGEKVMFGRYEQDNDLSNGMEDLEWEVLDVKDGRALLITSCVIDQMRFADLPEPETVSEITTWETSVLRKWLNETFINNAFDDRERTYIADTHLENPDNRYDNSEGGNDTVDNVFVLSCDEVRKYYEFESFETSPGAFENYAGVSTELITPPTDYANKRNESSDSKNGECWWLRTPGGVDTPFEGIAMCYVSAEGDAGEGFISPAYYNDVGVRPAMWVSMGDNVSEKESDNIIDKELCVGDKILFGKYEQDLRTDGVESLEWKVLDIKDEKALLISQYIIDTVCYDESGENTSWSTSTLRKWLNERFLNCAFSADEIFAIQDTALLTESSKDATSNGEEKTVDKIFILSLDELREYYTITNCNDWNDEIKTGYCQELVAEPVFNIGAFSSIFQDHIYEFDKEFLYENGYSDSLIGKNGAYWWARTPGQYDVATVGCWGELGTCMVDGWCSNSVEYGYSWDDSAVGVRPAMWVSLDKLHASIVDDSDRIVNSYEKSESYCDNKSPYIKDSHKKLSDVNKGDTIIFGSYEQDNNLRNGEEDIEWSVLDVNDGKALIISKYVLDRIQYSRICDDDWSWERCGLRKWLNYSFYRNAFSDAQKTYIKETLLDNSKYEDGEKWYMESEINTLDYVFCLSLSDILKYYNFSFRDEEWDARYSHELLTASTLYAESKGLLTHRFDDNDRNWLVENGYPLSVIDGNNYASWWLRASSHEKYECVVSEWGCVGPNEVDFARSSVPVGVRPAMWITIE